MVSYNNLFYLYLSLIALLLLVFSFFVSIQLKTIFVYLLNFVQVFKYFNKRIVFSDINYQRLCNLHLITADYFSCIAISELYLKINNNFLDKKVIYLSLGFIYSKLCYWHISEYYYLKSSSISSDDMQMNSALANFYSTLGYDKTS
uniref:Uncharacterized protein n=1 Tax=Polysiphonia elongata TaxID=159753 RepID=A0A1Z1MBH6_9FLOR|nr:hypothetical protein [Polysiphonia elongata]ARW63222.1 hypothetical protein [Polysiphonia elongata]